MPGNGNEQWVDVGAVAALSTKPLQEVVVGKNRVALVFRDGRFTALSAVCNHAGGPLSRGALQGDYVVCPWHQWKFHFATGEGEPGFEEDRVPTYEVRVENERVLINPEAVSKRHRKPHAPHPLTQLKPRGAPGGPSFSDPLRVVGISTTVMDAANPRPSTSEQLLEVGLAHAAAQGVETRLIKLNDLQFRSCEGYYSKSAHACTWPCSITQMDPNDQLDRVYEALVGWADVFLIATPIRWGNASSLYYKMAERMNCIQNQITIANRVLLQNKTAAFIVTGGQDNVQGVVGQLLTFFGELGCAFPPFPFVGHSRGWSAEDMERNIEYVAHSTELRDGTRALVDRTLSLSRMLLAGHASDGKVARGGRKANPLHLDQLE